MNTDPIADLLTRIRNGYIAQHIEVGVPHSGLKEGIVDVLQRYEFVDEYFVEENEGEKEIRIGLRYDDDGNPAIEEIKRVSKPSLRKYVKSVEIRPVRGGFGISIISTSKGVFSGEEAKKEGVGGEVIAKVW